MEKKIRVAIYSRVSSQDATRQTNLGQKGRLLDEATKKNWTVIETNPPYSDYESGKTIARYSSDDKPIYIKQRANFMRMFADINKYDGVMVTRVDRFGRDEEDIHHFLNLLIMNNKFLYILENDVQVDKSNINDPTIKAIIGINATVAAIERANDSKRIRDKATFKKKEAIDNKERFVWGRKPYRILTGIKETDGKIVTMQGKPLLDYVKKRKYEMAQLDQPYKFIYLYKELDPINVIKMYDMGQNLSQIAEALGCSRQPIRAIVKDRDLFIINGSVEPIKRRGLDIEGN